MFLSQCSIRPALLSVGNLTEKIKKKWGFQDLEITLWPSQSTKLEHIFCPSTKAAESGISVSWKIDARQPKIGSLGRAITTLQRRIYPRQANTQWVKSRIAHLVNLRVFRGGVISHRERTHQDREIISYQVNLGTICLRKLWKSRPLHYQSEKMKKEKIRKMWW